MVVPNVRLILSMLGVGVLALSGCKPTEEDGNTTQPGTQVPTDPATVAPTAEVTEAPSPTVVPPTATPDDITGSPAVSPTTPPDNPSEDPSGEPSEPISPTQTPTPPPTPSQVDNDQDGSFVPQDCDDTNNTVYPGAAEIAYDDIDQDCDGEDLTDVDEDGYDGGEDGTDCNDGDGAINPGAGETPYNSVDEDCDGVAVTDVDGDGYDGGEGGPDCDDNRDDVNPGAPETCGDSTDNDCNGEVDDGQAADATPWYPDLDGDGFGAGTPVQSCAAPAEGSWSSNSGDCDDSDGAVNPGALEVCDGIDNNCDDATDEPTAEDALTFYEDLDGDGFGNPEQTQAACDVPEGFSENPDDCDDGDQTVSPDAVERCNGADDNCNGAVDESAADAPTWYTDGDNDGYGDASAPVRSCQQPEGTAVVTGDCDDTNGDVNPDAVEICNGIDDDCNGSVDPATSANATTWYVDSDGDGFGSAGGITLACARPEGYVDNADDCEDSDDAINPEADEVCDGIDNNCNGSADEDGAVGAPTWYADADADTYGDADTVRDACSQPRGYVGNSEDCNDDDEDINPDGVEVCNSKDDNCDDQVDNDAEDAATWYADTDNDGSGDAASTTESCQKPTGYVADNNDCNDKDKTVYYGSVTCAFDVGGQSCVGILDDGLSLGDGFYTIDPDGSGAKASYTVQCLMTVAGGGWTLVGSFNNNDGTYNWTRYADGTNNLGNWRNSSTFGTLAEYKLKDYKSPAFSDVAATDLLAVDSSNNWASYEGAVGGGSLLATITGYTACQTTLLSAVGVTSNISTVSTYGEIAYYAKDQNDTAGGSSGCALGNFGVNTTDSGVISMAHYACGNAGFGQLGWRDPSGVHYDNDSNFCLNGSLVANTGTSCGASGWYGQTSVKEFFPKLCSYSLLYVR